MSIFDYAYKLGIVMNRSGKSEAVYLSLYSDDDYRLRIATHSPVHDCSCDCYCAALGNCSHLHTDADDSIDEDAEISQFAELFKRYLTVSIKHKLEEFGEYYDLDELDESEQDEYDELLAMTPESAIREKIARIAKYDGKYAADKVLQAWNF